MYSTVYFLNVTALSFFCVNVARGDIAETSLSDGEEVKLLNPCYSSLEVSSNNSDSDRSVVSCISNTFLFKFL